MTSGLLCAWYFHLPVVAGDDEVIELWNHSLEPLLRVHADVGVPANIAITGTLLERLAYGLPRAVDALRESLTRGRCEILGATYHEVAIPLIPLESLRRQLELDWVTKRHLLDVSPTAFYPGNFAWTPTLPTELTRLGYRSILLDSRHFADAMRTQSWRWESAESGMTSVMLETAVLDDEVHAAYRYATADGDLTLIFRSWSLVRQWTFGNTGLLHAPWETSIPARIEQLREQSTQALLTIADDGDRINPVSLANYRQLLTTCRATVLPVSVLEDLPRHRSARILSYLPTFIVGSLDDFWCADADARHYQLLLSELRDRVRGGFVSPMDLMALEDVFPIFWKNVARKRWYFDRIAELLRG